MNVPAVSSKPVHPRPQLVREAWIDLCGEWEFQYDDTEVGLDQGWHRGDTPARRGRSWCPTRRSRRPPGSVTPVITPWSGTAAPVHRHRGPGRRVLLHFGAVDYRATVWVNGQLVAAARGRSHAVHRRHHRPRSPRPDRPMAPQRRSWCGPRTEPDDATQPRGKQDWRTAPHVIWYHRTTGIWQPVWLEAVPDLHVDRIWRGPPMSPAPRSRSMDLDLSR